MATIIDPELAELSQRFWDWAGWDEEPPLDLTRAIALTLPLDVVSMSNLSLRQIEVWLETRGVNYRFSCRSRRLHGCLLAYRGAGVAFLDGSDEEPERRLTLAHETAHFLLDYWLPRARALEVFGSDILEVLDGRRAPTPEERIDSVLLEVSVRPYTHLLERDGDGSFSRHETWRAENRADALALELLAPAEAVCRTLEAAGATTHHLLCRRTAEELLTADYGLPKAAAGQYARRLAETLTGGPSVLEDWGL